MNFAFICRWHWTHYTVTHTTEYIRDPYEAPIWTNYISVLVPMFLWGIKQLWLWMCQTLNIIIIHYIKLFNSPMTQFPHFRLPQGTNHYINEVLSAEGLPVGWRMWLQCLKAKTNYTPIINISYNILFKLVHIYTDTNNFCWTCLRRLMVVHIICK